MLEFGSHYPDCPLVFIDENEFRVLWKGASRVFLVTYDDQFQKVKDQLPENIMPLAKAGGKSVYSNRQ